MSFIGTKNSKSVASEKCFGESLIFFTETVKTCTNISILNSLVEKEKEW